jgi:hypothetical protein
VPSHFSSNERTIKNLIRAMLAAAFGLFVMQPLFAQTADSVCTLNVSRTLTVPGYSGPIPTQSFVVTQAPIIPPKTAAAPKGVLILLPGGDGNIHLTPPVSSSTCSSTGTLDINSNNFLTRSRWLFAGKNFVVVTLDSATDFQQVTPPGLQGNQGNPLHVSDVVQVISWARSTYPGLKVWLVGTSRGTAGAWVASMNPAPVGPDGLVFASPLNSAGVPPAVTDPDSLQNTSVNLATVTVPTLLLGNDLDACVGSAPSNNATVAALFVGAKVTVKSITGGFNPLSTNPCDALTYHGFFGRERLAVVTITDWIK